MEWEAQLPVGFLRAVSFISWDLDQLTPSKNLQKRVSVKIIDSRNHRVQLLTQASQVCAWQGQKYKITSQVQVVYVVPFTAHEFPQISKDSEIPHVLATRGHESSKNVSEKNIQRKIGKRSCSTDCWTYQNYHRLDGTWDKGAKNKSNVSVGTWKFSYKGRIKPARKPRSAMMQKYNMQVKHAPDDLHHNRFSLKWIGRKTRVITVRKNSIDFLSQSRLLHTKEWC